ncbi:MAG: phosphoribosylanthranilate isomerase [Nitrospirae bacterium]|nr:phosphoribosylanthranilate isomerase [Nitrospirota bacterium]MBI3378209.1 phosphoribosylanthranilate isomerase [Nitrospirota bacterium]
MVKVKICGITNLDDAMAAADFGADALGFVFFKKSPRYISPANAKKIIKKLPPFISTVGVFVNEDKNTIEKVALQTGINIIQLHGDEHPKACNLSKPAIKAIRVKSIDNLEIISKYRDKVSAFLLDTYTPEIFGGTGQIFNWDIAAEAKKFGRVILAGGLTPENIEKAVRLVHPYAVDVSSGVEAEKGKKDHLKMKLFIERAKGIL